MAGGFYLPISKSTHRFGERLANTLHRRPTFTSLWDVIGDVIYIKRTFSGILFEDLSISDFKMNLSKIFQNFQNSHHFEVRAIFQTGSCTEVESYIKIGHAVHYIWVLFDALAEGLRDLWQFQNLTYFWPRDLVIWLLTHMIYGFLALSKIYGWWLGQVWWWLVKRTDRQTDPPSDEHTCQNWIFWQVTNKPTEMKT